MEPSLRYRNCDGREDVQLLDPQSRVRERDHIMRLLLRQPPQRRHVPLIVEDVPRQDQCDGQSRHQPEHAEHQREDDPRDKVQRVRKLDARPGTTGCSRRPSQAGG